jgi:hypothetical protein
VVRFHYESLSSFRGFVGQLPHSACLEMAGNAPLAGIHPGQTNNNVDRLWTLKEEFRPPSIYERIPPTLGIFLCLHFTRFLPSRTDIVKLSSKARDYCQDTSFLYHCLPSSIIL